MIRARLKARGGRMIKLGTHSRRLAMAAIAVAGIGAASIASAGVARADTLPAYGRDGFCSTQVANYGTPRIYVKYCTGEYKVSRSTYQFTQDALGYCPADGVWVELDETWLSPPTGGSPTILVGYDAYIS